MVYVTCNRQTGNTLKDVKKIKMLKIITLPPQSHPAPRETWARWPTGRSKTKGTIPNIKLCAKFQPNRRMSLLEPIPFVFKKPNFKSVGSRFFKGTSLGLGIPALPRLMKVTSAIYPLLNDFTKKLNFCY